MNPKTELLLPVFNFEVDIDLGNKSYLSLGFSKISSIETSIETQAIPEGGLNDRVWIVPNPVTAERQMVFENGLIFITEKNSSAIEKYQDLLRPGKRLQKITIHILDRDQSTIRKSYELEGSIVKKWSLQELDAMSNNLQIRHFEISYSKLTEVSTDMGLDGLFD